MSKKHVAITNKLTIIDNISIARYLNELSSNKDTMPLDADEEQALFIEYKRTGSEAIKNRLVMANLRFVVTIAKQFDYEKALLEDMINEGNMGLIKAIDKFDHTQGNRFLTFATWDIRQGINRYIHETLADIVQPGNRYRIHRVLKEARRRLLRDGNHTPTDEQLVELYMKLKKQTDPTITANMLAHINNETRGFISSNRPISDRFGGGTDDLTQEDLYQSGEEYRTDAEIKKNENKMLLNSVLSRLPERERTIVEYRFGLNGREEKTLDQLSELMGFTRERIGQLIKASLKEMESSKEVLFSVCREVQHNVTCHDKSWS